MIPAGNREARRIVESLRMPGRPLEELFGIVVCRRADGREVSLAELPLAQQFASAETVRAEGVVLSVPDGRSVRTLINATPIEAEGPVPDSVWSLCRISRRSTRSNGCARSSWDW